MTTERIVTTTVVLAIAIPADAGDEEAYAYVVDTVNETLREHQRSFTPESVVIDYMVVGNVTENAADPANYEEGDAF